MALGKILERQSEESYCRTISAINYKHQLDHTSLEGSQKHTRPIQILKCKIRLS